MYGAEPALADDGARSFRSGKIETVTNPPTIADGARTPSLGLHTFPIIRALVRDIATVSEGAIARTALFAAAPRALRNCAMWLLPLAAGFDAAENAFHWWLTEVPRFGVAWAYAVAASCAALKWLLAICFGLVAGYALYSAED